MKRIINGKRYNTQTAEKIGTFESEAPRNDFSWFTETLYRTQKGAFFLAGEGGANTKYASGYDGTYSGGSGIIPLTSDEAQDWAEKHLNYDECEGAFGENIEDA